MQLVYWRQYKWYIVMDAMVIRVRVGWDGLWNNHAMVVISGG